MSKLKKPLTKAKSNAVSTAVVRHPDSATLAALHKHIEERIADGGATTGHLKHMLETFKPVETVLPGDEVENLTMPN